MWVEEMGKKNEIDLEIVILKLIIYLPYAYV